MHKRSGIERGGKEGGGGVAMNQGEVEVSEME